MGINRKRALQQATGFNKQSIEVKMHFLQLVLMSSLLAVAYGSSIEEFRAAMNPAVEKVGDCDGRIDCGPFCCAYDHPICCHQTRSCCAADYPICGQDFMCYR